MGRSVAVHPVKEHLNGPGQQFAFDVAEDGRGFVKSGFHHRTAPGAHSLVVSVHYLDDGVVVLYV